MLKHLIIIAVFAISLSLATEFKTKTEQILNGWKKYLQALEIQEKKTARSINIKEIKIDDNEDIQKLLEELFDKMREIINKGDPIFIDHQDFSYDTPLLKFKGQLNQAKLGGYANFSIDKLNVTKNLDFDIGFGFRPLITDGIYDLDFNLLSLLPLFGDGNFGALMEGFNISLALKLVNGTNNILQAQYFKLDFKVDKLELDFDNLLGGEKLSTFVNEVLTDVGAALLMQYKDTILGLINPLLKIELNRAMLVHNITLDVFISTIHQMIDNLPK